MPDKKRFALIIATSNYEDPDLKKLIAPAQDAQLLAEVLKDPKIGGFEIKVVLNETYSKIKEEIENFLLSTQRSDFILLYFSCHGIKNKEGHLYFAAINTKRRLLESTGISANFVNNLIRDNRSRQQLLLLDCCFSGAFARGMTPKSDKLQQIHVKDYFEMDKNNQEDKGRVIITASDSLQYSFEGEKLFGKGIYSVFTRFIVEGLKTGKADLNNDGYISSGELYDYVHDNLTNSGFPQKPEFWVLGLQGRFYIATNPIKMPSIPSPILPPPLILPPPTIKLDKKLIIIGIIGVVAIVGIVLGIILSDHGSGLSKNITVYEDAKNTIINLDSYFGNSENQTKFTYAISSNSNTELVQPFIDGTSLILSYLHQRSGLANISVNATDFSSHSVIITFSVRVIPLNDKPIISINHPMNNSVFSEGEEILFDAISSDLEDSDISRSIKWISNIDGEFGEGPRIFYPLSKGSHLITASTKDKAGVTADSKILIKINTLDKPPVIKSISITPPSPKPGNTVTLSAEVTDLGNDINNNLTYQWKQISGPPIDIINTDTNNLSFIAPAVTAVSSIDIILIVTDKDNNSDSHTISFNIYP
jgi:hypothetical protein